MRTFLCFQSILYSLGLGTFASFPSPSAYLLLGVNSLGALHSYGTHIPLCTLSLLALLGWDIHGERVKGKKGN